MQLGIFTHYLPGSLEETASRAHALGLNCVQLNLQFKDWRFEPGVTTRAECHRVREVFDRHGLAIAAIAAYVNLAAPDASKRRVNLQRLNAILRAARDLGATGVATESGTHHPDDDWAPHPENATQAALDDMAATVCEVTASAREAGAALLLEPSVGNVIDTPEKALWLLGQVHSPALGLVADPANFIDGDNIDLAPGVLANMYARLGEGILLAHAKDFRRLDGEPRERHHHPSDPALYGGVEYPAPGLGDMDYRAYLRWLARLPSPPPLIIEHIEQKDVPRAKSFIEGHLLDISR